ncbi:MAG: ribosomal protein S18-alanine N-acetyltransferase [Janthinobacterium lividum]
MIDVKTASSQPISSLKVTIRAMRIDDIEYVSRLERRCYTLPWSSSAYVTEVGNSNAYYTVAVLPDGTIVGYCGMWVIMDELHMTTIAVDPSVRGLKIGERLLHDMIEEGIKRGAERATLEVRERNTVAHNLYVKYGFEDVAVRKNYYSDNGENAIIMWANDLILPPYQAMLQDYQARLTER